METLENTIVAGYRLGEEEAFALMQESRPEDLYALAHRLRTHYQGKAINTCSIMNARSGRCSEDCKWCSQSKFYETNTEIYPLIKAPEAVKEARYNADKGVHRFSLVTSGRTLSQPQVEQVCSTYKTIRSEVNIHLCASLGLLNLEQLKQLRESGVEHYHCNIETAPSFFDQVCTTHTIEEKLQTIAWAREAGLKICSGGIMGMGETARQRIEFAVTLQKIGAVSIPLNILNPIPGTPLENMPPLSDEEVLLTAAMTRIINPEAEIRLAGGRTRIKHLEEKLLFCGVSASIVGDLLTTTGSDIATDQQMFRRLGFEL